MHGSDVEYAQRLLKHSKWGDLLRSPIDGQFGPLTAAAVYRAKFWLGYPAPDRAFGDKLERLLRAGVLPSDMAMTRHRRVEAYKAKHGFAERSLAYAHTQIGVKESPAGSNLNPYGEHWHENGVPWCGLFVCTAWLHGGANITEALAHRWGYVPNIVADAHGGLNGLVAIHPDHVLPNDAVCFDWPPANGVADHVGLVVKVERGVICTIEGNTSALSNSNGGEVEARVRSFDEVAAFARNRAA